MFLQESPRAFGYTPIAQRFGKWVFLYVRGRSDAGTALRVTREELAKLDPNVALARPSTLRAEVDRYLIPQRLAAVLIGVFGLLGVLLAMTGLYGVLAFGVTQRLREFGIRLALGARAGDILTLVLRHGFALVAIGVVIGLGAAFAVGQVVSRFLFGMSPVDPITYVGVVALVIGVSLVASLAPARRGASADPMTSLRSE
jgi:ABC-type antimicrobial peptide transport system permease subunit